MPLDHTRLEQLIGSLAGILSARVLIDDLGTIEGVHIVAESEFLPKRIVRNVESALCAGLGLEIDRRIVSVANVREGASLPTSPPASQPVSPPASQPVPARESTGEPVREPERRILFESIEVHVDTGWDARCRVALRLGADLASREATGPDSRRGRAEMASRATVLAIRQLEPDRKIDLEELTITAVADRPIVLVSIRALEGRRSRSLTGIAAIERSTEEAAALATLNATHRWLNANAKHRSTTVSR